jgi:superfamily I DNA and RNA helicase
MGDENHDSDYLPDSHDRAVSDEEIYKALIEQDGNMSAVGRALKISRTRVAQRIDRSVVLTALRQDLIEDVVDTAEQNVYRDVRNGDATANRFVLGTLGKTRGWAQGVAGTGKDGEIVVQINRLSDKPSGE